MTDKKCKYVVIDLSYYKAIHEYFSKYHDNRSEEYANFISDAYKPGRPFFFIPVTDTYGIALKVVSGEKENFITKRKNQDIFNDVFYYINNHVYAESLQNIEPYISFRSPLLVPNAFVHEITSENIIEVEQYCGEMTLIKRTDDIRKAVLSRSDEIKYLFKQFKNSYDQNIKSDKYVVKNAGASKFTNLCFSRNILSRDLMNGNYTRLNKIKDIAVQVRNKMHKLNKSLDIQESKYKKIVYDSIRNDENFLNDFIEDRIKRRTPYVIYKNLYKEEVEVKKTYSELEQLLLMSSFINGTDLSNNYAFDTSNDLSVVDENKKNISKYIVESYSKRNNHLTKNKTNNSYVYYYSQFRIPRAAPLLNEDKKDKLIDKISRNNPAVIISKDTKRSFLIGPNENKFNKEYQTNLILKANENKDKALDLLIMQNLFSLKNSNNSPVVLFRDLFNYNETTARVELIVLETKRKLFEELGIPTRKNEMKLTIEYGEEIITSLHQMKNISLTASNIVQNIKKLYFENEKTKEKLIGPSIPNIYKSNENDVLKEDIDNYLENK